MKGAQWRGDTSELLAQEHLWGSVRFPIRQTSWGQRFAGISLTHRAQNGIIRNSFWKGIRHLACWPLFEGWQQRDRRELWCPLLESSQVCCQVVHSAHVVLLLCYSLCLVSACVFSLSCMYLHKAPSQDRCIKLDKPLNYVAGLCFIGWCYISVPIKLALLFTCCYECKDHWGKLVSFVRKNRDNILRFDLEVLQKLQHLRCSTDLESNMTQTAVLLNIWWSDWGETSDYCTMYPLWNFAFVLGLPSSRASVTELQLSQLINNQKAKTKHITLRVLLSVVSY